MGAVAPKRHFLPPSPLLSTPGPRPAALDPIAAPPPSALVPNPALVADLSATEAVLATSRSHQAVEASVAAAHKILSELRPKLAKAEMEAKNLEKMRTTMKKALECTKSFKQSVEKKDESGHAPSCGSGL